MLCLGIGPRRRYFVEASKEDQILLCAQAVIQPWSLGENADGLANSIIVCSDFVTRHGSSTSSRGNQCGQHTHSSGFTRAVRTQETKHGPCGNGQRQVLNGNTVAKCTGQFICFYSVHM